MMVQTNKKLLEMDTFLNEVNCVLMHFNKTLEYRNFTIAPNTNVYVCDRTTRVELSLEAKTSEW